MEAAELSERDWPEDVEFEIAEKQECLLCYKEFLGNRAKRVCKKCWDEAQTHKNLVMCRAIDEHEIIWRMGYYVPMIGPRKVIHFIYSGLVDSCRPDFMERHRIRPETLCRFTGRFDKTGARIWEHDILEPSRPGRDVTPFVVSWDARQAARWVCTNEEEVHILIENWITRKRLGSIFDALIKAKEAKNDGKA